MFALLSAVNESRAAYTVGRLRVLPLAKLVDLAKIDTVQFITIVAVNRFPFCGSSLGSRGAFGADCAFARFSMRQAELVCQIGRHFMWSFEREEVLPEVVVDELSRQRREDLHVRIGNV